MNKDNRESSSDAESDRCEQLDVSFSSDEGEEMDIFQDKKSDLPLEQEWFKNLSEEDGDESDADLAVAAGNAKKRSCAETARMFKLRRNLDQLDCSHRQKERDVLKAREKLKLCRHNIESLLEQRENLEREIEQQKATDNAVTVFRLRSQHKHLCQKLQSEEELEGHVNSELKLRESELSEVEVELGKVSSLRQELHEEEQLHQAFRAQKAATRLQHERKASQKLQVKIQQLRNKQAAMLKEEESECQRKIDEARANRKIAAKYLKQTVKRKHQEEAEEEKQNREFVEKRIQAVKSLKSNIAATQESLRVQQSRAKANAQKKEQQQRQLRESLQAQGINSIKHMHQQKQREETKRKQEEFEETQKSKRVETVAKILQEEQRTRRGKKSPALVSKPSAADALSAHGGAGEMLLRYRDPAPPAASQERASLLREISDISSSPSASSDNEDLEEMRESSQRDADHHSLADSLAEPEFSGLWDQDFKNILPDKPDLMQTKVLQEEPPAASEKFNQAAKKVPAKELRRPSFISKPEVIVFKDFEVGKMYKKKIVLTNSSYTINHCKLLGVSTQLKDFISVNFEPPGSLSTGMSFDMQAIFQPKINEDLKGEIHFASAAGSFSVPVSCSIKKCLPEVDVQLIDFGSHVVGQTITRTITLTNKGALATLFSLDGSTFLSPETSHVQLPHKTCASTCQDTSSSTPTTNQESCSSLDGREVQPKQQNEEPSVALQQQQQPVLEAATAGTEAEPETCQLSHVDPQTDETTSDYSFIRLGNVREGEIGPFESVKLELIFTPTIPVEAKLDFYIKFSDKTCKAIPIQARGVAVGVPVWVVQTSIDLKICMFDRLYQDTIMVQSRARTALELTFEVCPQMRKHMEVVPKKGFIQAQSSFNAQLKFKPRRSLAKDAEEFFDSDTGVLEVPMTVRAAGQVQPAHFAVHAVVTSTDLQFDHAVVDFGSCSIYESVKKSVRLTNLSLLPQDFGLLGIPEFVDVQPNDGFGTLLPQETLELHLIFSARSAKEYNFQLNCKSGINRDFPLSCRAVGVHPPLQLSCSVVQFGATAVGDHSTGRLHLIYSHTESQQAGSPLGRNAAAPAVPRLFSFAVPANSDVSVTPATGRLLPGEKCLVQVTFRPRLLDQEIKEEALHLLHQAQLLREKELQRSRLAEQEMKKDVPVEPGKGKKVPVNAKGCKVTGDAKTEKLPESPCPVDVQPGSEQYRKARTSLLSSFRRRYREHVLPCFVSDGDPPEEDTQVQPAWSPSNTIYLKLQCPAVQPPLVVVSNNGHNIVDFGHVVVGEKVIQKLTVQNISKEPLDLTSSVLDVLGPFSLLNALRCIRPGEKHTLVLAFSPTLEKKHGDLLEVHSQAMTLALTLRGEGVVPAVTSSHTGGLLDFGYVLEKESASQVVKLQNSSVVTVGFRALLASLSPSRPQGGVDQLSLLLDGHTDPQLHPARGTQNYSGLSVFSVVPAEGSIAPGESKDVTVRFQPDHPSVNYDDKLTIELMNKTKVCEMDLKGAASSHNMYLRGGDLLTVPIESLLPSNLISSLQLTESEGVERPSIPVLVTLQAHCSSDTVPASVRELQVGCIRSTQSSKKSGEFFWDSLTALQQQGFSVEPSKGNVEAGHTRTITIRWSPFSGYKPSEVVEACVLLTVKGDETTVYRVTLMALVSVTAD